MCATVVATRGPRCACGAKRVWGYPASVLLSACRPSGVKNDGFGRARKSAVLHTRLLRKASRGSTPRVQDAHEHDFQRHRRQPKEVQARDIEVSVRLAVKYTCWLDSLAIVVCVIMVEKNSEVRLRHSHVRIMLLLYGW